MLEDRARQAMAAQEVQRAAEPVLREVNSAHLGRALIKAQQAGVDDMLLSPFWQKWRLASLAQSDSALASAATLAGPDLLDIQTFQLAHALQQSRQAGVAADLVRPLELRLRAAALAQAQQVANAELLVMKTAELSAMLARARECGCDTEAELRQMDEVHSSNVC